MKRLFQYMFYLLLGSAVVGFICWGIAILHDAKVFPVKDVVVQCNPMIIDQTALQKLITPLVQKGFFCTDVVKIRDVLQGLPEIASVKVRRIWPNKIVIQLSLEHAVARWNEHSFLNQYGEIFSVYATLFGTSGLPRFLGYEHVAVEMLDDYYQMNSILEPLGVKIDMISLDASRSWCIQLNNGMILKLGQRDILNRLRRFIAVYPKVLKASRRAKKVDLRYAHGMAVEWSA